MGEHLSHFCQVFFYTGHKESAAGQSAGQEQRGQSECQVELMLFMGELVYWVEVTICSIIELKGSVTRILHPNVFTNLTHQGP